MLKASKKQLDNKIVSTLSFNVDEPGRVLDFGCGDGALLNDLSKLLNEESILIGVDASQKTVEKAKGLYSHIDFKYEKFIDKINFPDESFDAIVSVDTLECVPEKEQLIDEFHRILKPDGKIVIAHWDWDTQVYFSKHEEIIRTLVKAYSDWQQDWMETSDGQMGRKLWPQFQTTEKFEGEMDAWTLLETEYKPGYYGYDRLQDLQDLVKKGKIDADKYQKITKEMNDLHENGDYFYSLTSYIYYGKRLN